MAGYSDRDDLIAQILIKLLTKSPEKEFVEQIRKINDPNACYRIIKAGDYIVREDTVLRHVIIVFKGEYASWRSAASGRSHLSNRLKAPQFIGITRALNPDKASLAECIAMQDCELLILGQKYFVDLLKEHGELAVETLRNICSKMDGSTVKLSDKSLYDSQDNLLIYLNNYMKGLRKEKERYCVAVTKKEMADAIGVSDRTLYRLINQLKQKGYLSREEGCIYVSRSQLRKIEQRVIMLNN